MSRSVYVNGAYKLYRDAMIHAEDRGFQFADAVYEVIEVLDGALVDATRHLDRLERSLGELQMRPPMSRAALLHVAGETLKRNRVTDGSIYIQVTRGAGPRDFTFPPAAVKPTLVVIARPQSQAKIAALAEDGIAVVSLPDNRWERCDIKTVMLLPACLAKNVALASGARDALFIDNDGLVTEGASSNAWIIARDGTLVTRQADSSILGGITRQTLLDVAAACEIKVQFRPFSIEEAKSAREAFLTSASNTVMPIVAIDGAIIGNGKPGSIARRLRAAFHGVAEISNV